MQISDLTPDISPELGLPWFLLQPQAALDAYMGPTYLVLDLETTNKDKGSPLNPDNRIVCAAWRWAGEDVQYHYGSEFEQHALIEAVERALKLKVPIVAHAAKFELGWFKRLGFNLREFLVYDTMLGDYVLLGNDRSKRLDLGRVAKRWGYPDGKEKTVDALIKAQVCPSEIREDLLRARVIKDVRQTDFVFRRQREKLYETNRLAVQFTRCITTPWLADIEPNGLALSEQRVKEECERASREYAAAVSDFESFTGGINHKSPAQLAHYLYGGGFNADGTQYTGPNLGFHELTRRGKPIRGKSSKQFPDGQPKTDDQTLEKLSATTASQRKFLELRARVSELNAELSKTLQFFQGIVDEYGGKFYGVFNQHITKTHRLSSNGRKTTFKMYDGDEKSVQFQNFPRKFKDLIKAAVDGWKHWEIDGSQLEYRTAIFLGQDANGLNAIRNDLDIHKYSAMALFDLDNVELVTKEFRQQAKPTTFRPLYGGSQGTPGQLRYFEWWKSFHHKLESVQEGWTFEVLRTKRLVTPWGLRYYWPYTRMSANGYIDNKTNIYNYAVQALATAEIIPIACVHMWHRMQALGLRAMMNNTVHDSVMGACPPEEVGIIKQLGYFCFTMDVYRYLTLVYKMDFNVPLGAGIKIGERWNSPDSEETELNVEADGECWWKGSREKLELYKRV